ncbi:MAG: ribosomal-processing cysteine protease Prp [Lachnospiraceae bacterium]|jgi:uncharacterized protein YsxB (DUF464 family)|nr:ribosomal-processing cysteine protease Prp [Lachnospiraceae bacterium]
MTKVQIFQTKAGIYRSFQCKGHTEYTMEGEDIVCAGVSAIVINTINCLEDLLHENLRVEYDEVEGGYIVCNFLSDPTEKGQFLVDCMIHGLEWIQGQYGKKYLELDLKEVDVC